MINREVIYDRNLTGSYMKIPVSIGHEFDERMMLRRKLPGLLPVERCYIDGTGQYWYNISGKQSLDTYCRIQKIRCGCRGLPLANAIVSVGVKEEGHYEKGKNRVL